jgi:hypothetical protein
MAESRTGAKAVALNGRVYVIGGGKGVPGPDTIHPSVEYATMNDDGSLEPWKMASPLNTPTMFLAAVASGGILYAVGGEYFPEGRMKLLNTVERAEVRSDGSLGPWIPCAPMNTPRRSPTSVVVDGHLYAIGGYNGTFLRTVERARILPDGGLGAWEYVPQLLTMPRYIHGGAARGNRIYVLGGHMEESGRGSGAAEWTSVGPDGVLAPWNVTNPLNQPRFLAGSAAADRLLFIVGGYDGGYLDSVEIAEFGPDGGLADWRQTTPLSTPREGAAVAVIEENIYVMGGSNQGMYLKTVAHATIGQDGSLGFWQSPP